MAPWRHLRSYAASSSVEAEIEACRMDFAIFQVICAQMSCKMRLPQTPRCPRSVKGLHLFFSGLDLKLKLTISPPI